MTIDFAQPSFEMAFSTAHLLNDPTVVLKMA